MCLCYRLLELGLEGKVIRSQDLSTLILMVARNVQGHQLAWNFVKKNWDTLVEKLVKHDGDTPNGVILYVYVIHHNVKVNPISPLHFSVKNSLKKFA